ncbi:MAG: toxin-antitoxin system, antitoxin component, Xre family protein [Desulfobacterales bacterium CG2_30_60_27]|nr:MAG: toxin-antitoxin system, antitoxin component, Xre family protein [Desulfobacterales bacterium CG2_30_60_27]
MQTQHTQALFDKINRLPPEKVAVVEDFVEFLGHRGQDDNLVWAASALSEKSFQQAWDNQEDAEYDNL